MLLTIPGITSKNYRNIILEVESVLELSNMSEAEIDELIGSEAGRQIYRFFNRNVFEE